MPKRKRADFEDQKSPMPEKELKRRGDRLLLQIERGSQILHRALKIARGFERQKLGRRQKSARENQEDIRLSRLEVEVQTLKVGLSRRCVLNRFH